MASVPLIRAWMGSAARIAAPEIAWPVLLNSLDSEMACAEISWWAKIRTITVPIKEQVLAGSTVPAMVQVRANPTQTTPSVALLFALPAISKATPSVAPELVPLLLPMIALFTAVIMRPASQVAPPIATATAKTTHGATTTSVPIRSITGNLAPQERSARPINAWTVFAARMLVAALASLVPKPSLALRMAFAAPPLTARTPTTIVPTTVPEVVSKMVLVMVRELVASMPTIRSARPPFAIMAMLKATRFARLKRVPHQPPSIANYTIVKTPNA